MYLFRYTRLHPFPTTAKVEVNLYNLYTTRRVRTAIYFVEIGTGSVLLMRFFFCNSAAVIRSVDGRNASATFLRKFRAAEITNNLVYTHYNNIVYCYYYYSYVTLKKTFVYYIYLYYCSIPNHGHGNGSHHTYRHCVITSRPIQFNYI